MDNDKILQQNLQEIRARITVSKLHKVYPVFILDPSNDLFYEKSQELGGYISGRGHIFDEDLFCSLCHSFFLHILAQICIGTDQELKNLILNILELDSNMFIYQEYITLFEALKTLKSTKLQMTRENYFNIFYTKNPYRFNDFSDGEIEHKLRGLFLDKMFPLFRNDTYEPIAEVIENRYPKINYKSFFELFNKIKDIYISVFSHYAIYQNIEQRCSIVSKNLASITSETAKETYEIIELEKSNFNIEEPQKHKTMKDLFYMSLQDIDRMIKTDGYSGVPSGFIELDVMTDGYQNGDFIVVGARSSMGKTAFAINNAINISNNKNFNKKILFFSLEMSALQIGKRIISTECGIDLLKIRSANLDLEELQEIVKYGTCLQDNIIFNDSSSISTRGIDKVCSETENLGFVFIDYLQIIKPDKKSFNKVDEVGKISMELKHLAKKYNVPFVVLSQLSRQPDARDNKKPVLSDLRDSGSIEQDADMVILLYREDYYLRRQFEVGNTKKNNEIQAKLDNVQGKAEILIAKQRNGPIGNIIMNFNEKTGRFSN